MKTLCVVLALCLAGCAMNPPATTTTSAAPTAQQVILQADKTLADAASGAVKAAIALRQQGKITPADATTIENYAKVAAALSDGIATEMQSADAWTTQKAKIAALVQLAAFPAIASNVDPSIGALVQQIAVLAQQIAGQVAK